MNILFLIGKYPNYGGTEVVTTVLANSFIKKGYNVTIVSFEQTVPELRSELDTSIELYQLSYPVISAKNIKNLKQIIATKTIDVILNQWCLPFYVTKLCNAAIGKTGCKLISVLHGVPDRNSRLVYVENKIKSSRTYIAAQLYKLAHKTLLNVTSYNLKYVYLHSDKYVVLSKSFISTFISISRIKSFSKLMVIGNPLTILNKKYSYDVSLKEKTILYVGRIDYIDKRVHRIIEAWERLFLNNTDWNLTLVGDGPAKEQLEAYVKNKQISRVNFKGFTQSPPAEHYEKASILLLTSDLESFGLVVTEAMSYGVVPLVYGSYTAVYDIITDSRSGFITSMPYSENETVNKLQELMNDPKKLERMAKQALQKSEEFGLEKVLEKWETLFSELHVEK